MTAKGAKNISDFVFQEGDKLDLIMWHGTAADNLDSILKHGIQAQETANKGPPGKYAGKVFIAANRSDATYFAQGAIERAKQSGASAPTALLFAIRVPAEARDKLGWSVRGIDTWAIVDGGIPPDWIVSHRIIHADGTVEQGELRKSMVEDGLRYAVIVCGGSGDLAKAHVKDAKRTGSVTQGNCVATSKTDGCRACR